MGNELNKKKNFNPIENEHLIFKGFSNKLPLQNKNLEQNIVIIEDKEDVLISNIFKITLYEKDKRKYIFLNEYYDFLLSQNNPTKFRIDNLEYIIEYLMKDYKNPLNYLFECFHRSIEMIEINPSHKYDNNYKEIHRILAYYIGTILTEPEELEINLDFDERYNSFKKYLKYCNIDELGFCIYDITSELEGHDLSLKIFFIYLFKAIHEQNLEKRSFFFDNINETLGKNISILTSVFLSYPYSLKYYLDLSFRDYKEKTGANFENQIYISKYIDISPLEGSLTEFKSIFNLNSPKFEIKNILNEYINILNSYLSLVADFLILLYELDKDKTVLGMAFEVIKLNMDKIKTMKNNKILSKNTFLFNLLIILNKIFFKEYDEGIKNDYNLSKFIFKVVENIDPLFSLTNNYIPFDKFDRMNPEIVHNFMDDNNYKDIIPTEFNLYTKLYFIHETINKFVISNFNTSYENITKKIKALTLLQGYNINENDEISTLLYLQHLMGIYMKNKDCNKDLLRFSEISTFLIFSLNNNKYSKIKLNELKYITYNSFLDDFYNHINYDDNFTISLMPQYIYENLFSIVKYIKKYDENTLIENFSCSKSLTYFSLIFSCQENLIRNPHFRMEIFDIMIFIFSNYELQDNTKKLFSLLNQGFIKKSLMVSILKVFVDAERLGTSNQFYEKFVVRAKILILIQNINKNFGRLFEDNIKLYIEKYPEEGKKLVNNLLNDLIYLNDECIDNLKIIKAYQDLISDKERYDKLTYENKKFEENKFKDKDRIVRVQIKLFNNSLKFLLTLCNHIQNFFIENNFITNLAGFLNYSLKIFGSPLDNTLKLKNINEYNFNPNAILGILLSIYSAFFEKKEFIKAVIKDERSYNFTHFDRAKNLAANNKNITMTDDDFNKYVIFVDTLRKEEKIIKSEEINYDDAPQEFYDGLTFNIMTDPVKLPKSNVILDRKTIETHLLSDQTDPFNREPLTKDMLIPCPELKKRIEEYMINKKNEKNKSKDVNEIII